ncbi:MAG: acyltransferase, partial [Hyphomicrobiaceae bacterium]
MALPSLTYLKSAPRLAGILEPDRNSFGVIRLAMAIAVLVSHSYWFTTGSKIADPMVRFTGHSIGEHAVQVFF